MCDALRRQQQHCLDRMRGTARLFLCGIRSRAPRPVRIPLRAVRHCTPGRVPSASFRGPRKSWELRCAGRKDNRAPPPVMVWTVYVCFDVGILPGPTILLQASGDTSDTEGDLLLGASSTRKHLCFRNGLVGCAFSAPDASRVLRLVRFTTSRCGVTGK